MHDYMVSCVLLLHLALCFSPIRKDPRPIFGLQPTSWGPLLSISLTHMCVATHFISCIIHKHTHTHFLCSFLYLCICTPKPPCCAALHGLSLGLTTANVAWEKPNARKKICGHRIPTGWNNRAKKSIGKERDAEKVWTAAQSLSGPPSDTVSDDNKWKTTVIKHNQTHREKITLLASLKYVIVL